MTTITDIGTLIVRSPDICGDRPRIANTRFSVQQAVALHKEGLTAEAIVAEYSFLTLAQVYAALAYYYANRDEIETALAEEEATYDQLMTAQATSQQS